MTTSILNQFINTETSFITDIEEIVDVLDEIKEVYLYDTSGISSHELAFKNHNALLFLSYAQNTPILITDTIAKEMRLLEDEERRYLSYLSQFNQVLYVKEENLIDLLKVDYELSAARSKFIIASERAFTSIQLLKERVKETKQFFSKADQMIFNAYDDFLLENGNVNRGELSLLWVSTIIEQLPGQTQVTFVGMDHDLYDFVERSYFSTTKASPFSNDIYFSSNDRLLYSTYSSNSHQQDFAQLISIYRKADRKTRYFKKVNKLLNLNQQKEKISNSDFQHMVMNDGIEVIY
ncbi:hypothetical protein LC040_15550 [Bacillus tianshenii]|nr:hypothetical protein LC040_15550 [Bacillus tianshenii]